ncbi:decapping endonuclease targeting mRNA [Coemansia sp. RSA 2611]|nr:decapping endonuclease targeting mRNA [Coemansia sp. RSA 2611]
MASSDQLPGSKRQLPQPPAATKQPRLAPEMKPLARFALHPLSKYRLACPQFKEPRELLSFSYDDQRQMQMDNRQLRYYQPPQLDPPLSLYAGIEQQILRDSSKNEHIDGLLAALTHLNQDRQEPADFVMYRGMLTRLFVTPFSTRDRWSMNATRVGQTIYVEEDLLPEKLAERQSLSEQHQRATYGGYKFESLCMIDAPAHTLTAEQLAAKLQARESAIVNTNSEYCSVFRTQLGPHALILGAEVDCVDGEKLDEFPARGYRELKTSRVLDSDRAQHSFERYKLLKCWAQSFIAGIPRVTIGFRDDEGYLREVRDIRTQDMPRIVRNKPRMWEANVCMNFATQILQFLRYWVSEQGPEVQYRLEYDPDATEIRVHALGKQAPFVTAEYIHSLSK